jgi:hypothetical protein
VIVVLLACVEEPSDTVAMSGVVLDDRDGDPVGRAEIAILDQAHEPLGNATADDEGAFTVDVPSGESFFLHASADSFVTTGFSGLAGTSDFSAPAGLPWVARDDYVDDVKFAYDACSTYFMGMGMAIGEVTAVVVQADPSTYPQLPGATVLGRGSDGASLPACYAGEDGKFEATRTTTASNGFFVVMGIAPGTVLFEVSVPDGGGGTATDVFELDMPEEGLLPLYSLAVRLQ